MPKHAEMTTEEKKNCDTCAHEKDNSGYCLDCYFRDKWQGKDRKQNEES